MLCAARVHHHAMQRARLFDNPVHRLRDALLGRHVRLHGEEAVRVALGDGGELFAGRGNVDRVDAGGAVVETAFGDAEADATVGARDCLGVCELKRKLLWESIWWRMYLR